VRIVVLFVEQTRETEWVGRRGELVKNGNAVERGKNLPSSSLIFQNAPDLFRVSRGNTAALFQNEEFVVQ